MISNLQPFIKLYNCKEIKFLAGCKDWEKVLKNNPEVALNFSCNDIDINENKIDIKQAYISRHNSNKSFYQWILMVNVALLGSNKIVCITQGNNFKMQWRFLLFELFTFI